jgi:hypothetical protein
VNDDRLIEERVLRAALRLEADERPRRLNADAIGRAAEREAPLAPAIVALGWVSIAILSLAGVAIALRVAAFLVAAILSGDALGVAITLITAITERVEIALAVATQPAVPIAILTCVIVAAYHERHQAEGEAHVRAS